jgi:hypothetical protein
MNWLKETALQFALKWSGAKWIWDKASGLKTYSAGASAILLGMSKWLEAFSASDGATGFIELIKTAPDNPGTALILAGWAAIGLAHKADKAKSGQQ